MSDDMQERAREAFRRAGLVINAEQAEALAALLWDGELKGTSYPNVEPPRVAALVAMGEREGIDQEDLARDRKTGEYLTDTEGSIAFIPPDAPSHTLGVVCEDGTVYQIVRAGLCWPDPTPCEDLS